MTEPTTAAGPTQDGPTTRKPHGTPFSEWTVLTATNADGVRWFFHVPTPAIEAEARQQDGSALRSVAQAVVLAATKHTPEIVALNRILAALPPSAPPALDVERLTEAVDAWWTPIAEHVSGPGVYSVTLDSRAVAAAIAAEYARLQEQKR